MSTQLVLGLVFAPMLALLTPSGAKAALVQFEFHGTQTGNPAATVQAVLALESSLVVPNGTFTQANLSSFAVTYHGAFTASSTALPPSLSGQFNHVATVFSSLFVNNPFTIPGHTGTNNVQFFGANGQSWAFGVTGPAPGPLNVTGTGTWTVAAVPLPAAIWLFGSGAGLLAIRTWRGYSPS